MNSRTLVWIAVAAVVALVAFFAFRPSGGGSVENVDAAGVQAAQASGARVIDVRTPGEFEMGHIPGAENVPIDTLGAAIQTWDKDAEYVVYCATGSRSASAVEQFKAAGFTNVKHFDQGIVAYQGELEGGQQSAAPSTPAEPAATPSGTPVMYEFFTDW